MANDPILRTLTMITGRVIFSVILLFLNFSPLISQKLETSSSDSMEIVLPQPPPQPDWVKNGRIVERSAYYWGIGKSEIGRQQADDEARLNFSRNVFTHVQTMMEHRIEETNFRLKEEFKNLNIVSSQVSMRGMSITEEYYDAGSGYWYSLMRYEKNVYDSLIADEIRREINRMKRENELEEIRQQEAVRHELSLMKIDSMKAMTDIQRERTEESIQAEKMKRREERKAYLKRNYGNFIRMRAADRIINSITAETPEQSHSLGVKSNIEPFEILELSYRLRIFRVLEAAVRGYGGENRVELQDSHVKLQLLSGAGEIYRTSLAIGYEQYSSGIHRIHDLAEDVERLNMKYSLFAAANVNLPEYYLTVSMFNDKRQTSIAAQWFPFFGNFSRSLSVAAELSYTRDRDWRNRFGDGLMLEPGLQFVVIPGRFNTMLAYENNEHITLSMEVMF